VRRGVRMVHDRSGWIVAGVTFAAALAIVLVVVGVQFVR
jgi:hypothetical protein